MKDDNPTGPERKPRERIRSRRRFDYLFPDDPDAAAITGEIPRLTGRDALISSDELVDSDVLGGSDELASPDVLPDSDASDDVDAARDGAGRARVSPAVVRIGQKAGPLRPPVPGRGDRRAERRRERLAVRSGERMPAPRTKTVAKPTGRAGRNLPAAIGVGVGLSAAVLASLLFYRPAFVVLVGLAAFSGCYELWRALGRKDIGVPLVPLGLACVVLPYIAWNNSRSALVCAVFVAVVVAMAWLLVSDPETYARDAMGSVFVIVYIPLLASFAILLARPDDGATRVIVFIATVVGNDLGGYIAGVLFGKHKMAPRISPKKTWEGFAGSLVSCTAIGAICFATVLDSTWLAGLAFGAAVMVASTVGDLTESLIKRDVGIKDMSNLLPGHGGVMDRLDSLLMAAPIGYVLYLAFL